MANILVPSSLDDNYALGGLSVFPSSTDKAMGIDSKFTLYEAANNAETQLSQAVTYNGKYLVVNDASKFPSTGLLRIGPMHGKIGPAEFIHYSSRTDVVFSDLIRGFAASRQNEWVKGSYVGCAVMAEYHNALRDAVLNIESFLGVQNPCPNGPDSCTTTKTISNILTGYESKYLNPNPSFRAFPRTGKPPLNVHFQNFCNFDIVRFLWDFGDGSQSVERSPNHIYRSESVNTVKLYVTTSSGGQGIVQKNDYITVSKSQYSPFFYTQQISPDSNHEILFIDQSEGDITQRYWVFDDGTPTELQSDSNIHTTTHSYAKSGTYSPSLLLMYSDQKIRRSYSNPIEVL